LTDSSSGEGRGFELEVVEHHRCQDHAGNAQHSFPTRRSSDLGKIYSIVAYLWTFIGQTDYLPDLMESLGSIKDLNTRFTKGKVIEVTEPVEG
jgi:hypothetical protein